VSDYYPSIDAAVSALPLFRKTDPTTSVAAGERARAKFVTGQARAVLEALRAGPAGQTEIGRRCGLLPHQVNKRLADLKRVGLAVPTGREVVNEGGCREREWRVAS
jgi:DNA-binding MarR family transcriptional regulator